MAQSSWPFHDSETGGTPVYEDQWSIMARQWAATGVVGYPNDAQLQVFANGSGREVHVRAGRASVRGHWLDLDAQTTLPIAANTSGNPRIDYVVARLDPSVDGVALAVITGTPAASPAAPTLTTTDTGIYDLPLATVTVANAADSISAGNVTDQRQYSSLPPIPCLSTRRPTNPRLAQTIVETDTGVSRWWTGYEWSLLALPTTGGTLTGTLEIEHDTPAVFLNATDGAANSAIAFQTFGDNRFSIEFNPVANALVVARFDEEGDFIDIPWSVSLTNGLVTTSSATCGAEFVPSGIVRSVTLPAPPVGTAWSVVATADVAAAAVAVVSGTDLDLSLAVAADATICWQATAFPHV